LAIEFSNDFKSEFNGLLNKEVLILRQGMHGVFDISEKWQSVIDKILKKSLEVQNEEQWYLELAKDLVKTFPTGKKEGTAYYFRGNSKEISTKLRKFFEKHPEYIPSEEIKLRIINASIRYNKEMDFNPQYRTLAKYFISKEKTITDEEGINHIEEVSLLASYLENEPKEEEEERSEIGDWTTTIKN